MGAGPPGLFLAGGIVNEPLKQIMVFLPSTAWWPTAEKHNVNNRIAAYMLAIDRVAYAIRKRGIYA